MTDSTKEHEEGPHGLGAQPPLPFKTRTSEKGNITDDVTHDGPAARRAPRTQDKKRK
ncbi:hypothetical protein [Sinomonas atrocyanea]|jgi:hypothetical protein|uniref:hypothetical protein n=1 Tax=Sinomonas atrocyanea TaxID=37927 RepID=UPI00278B516F|nr:hypothetical protein [Sinomonas atrocyanea]MDQ0261913.1 hypothetical protein [Sinomonas atrocyanea]MDR6623677.1 hypothetical protein [Sinomonas atrocyanea]